MPVLDNPKQELACQERAKGKTEAQAYEIAGYSPNDGNACKFFNRPEIQGRVNEITGEIAKLVVKEEAIDKSVILRELAKIALAYIDPTQIRPADKRAACMDYARLNGDIIDKVEHGEAGEFEKLKAMNGTELADFIARRSEARRLRGTPVAPSGGTGEVREQSEVVREGSLGAVRQ